MRVQISNHKFKHILATITFVIISMLILQLTNAYPSIEGSFGKEERAPDQHLVNAIEALAELDFTADVTYGDFPLVVSFESNIDLGEDASFLWDFGDGVKSRLPTPTHAYTNPGQYDVELFVKNNSQTIAYVKKEAIITVVEEPTGNLSLLLISFWLNTSFFALITVSSFIKLRCFFAFFVYLVLAFCSIWY